MSEEALRAHDALMRSRACRSVLTDISMAANGVPLTAEILTGRWIAGARAEGIEKRHLLAVRKQVALDYHPDHQGGNAAIMQLANAALDMALAELEQLAESDVRAFQARSQPRG
jgi:hypothetical protein